MRLKVVIVDLEIPVRVKKWALRIGIPVSVLAGAGFAFAGPPTNEYATGQPLTKMALDDNFNYLQNEIGGDAGNGGLAGEIAALQTQVTALQGQVAGTWTAFTPVVASDGTAASIQLLNFSYSQVGKMVFIRGVALFGYTAPGAGGTYVKLSLPIAGVTGLQQNGIGTVLQTYSVSTAPATYRPGWGRIVSGDEGNVLLTEPAGNFVNGNAGSGYGFEWIVDGAYESN
jgi:hypothetical protein